MSPLLAFGIRNVFVALLQWSAMFIGGALAASLPVAWWSIHRARRSSTGGASFAWLLIVLGLFVTVPLVALFHAVPYAVERSLSEMVQGPRSREAVDWIVGLTADQLATTLNVQAPSARVDVRELKTQVAEAVRQARDMVPDDAQFGEIRSLLTDKSLSALQTTLDQVPVRNGTVVWSDLVERMRTVMAEQSSSTFADLSTRLDRAAEANIRATYITVAGCNLATLLLVAVFARPKQASRPAPPAGV
jgi:hypothetical protein